MYLDITQCFLFLCSHLKVIYMLNDLPLVIVPLLRRKYYRTSKDFTVGNQSQVPCTLDLGPPFVNKAVNEKKPKQN